ncbi:MAG: hypothetical protein JW719_06985 [Pirellulales bacterium]|nr:hypothetical protein [Pirellulales bacterium]
MNSPWTRWIASAAVLVVGVMLVSLYVVHSASAAWADVGEALNHVSTLSLKINTYQGKHMRVEETASFLDPQHVRFDTKEGSTVIDWEHGKIIALFPQQKLAVVGTLKDDPAKSQRQNWFARLKEIVGSKRAEEIGIKTWEGRKCKGWRIANDGRATTVWADEKTSQIVRIEMVMESGNVRTVMSNIRFNPPLDKSLFSLDVPPGYEVLATAPINVRDDSIEGLLLLLRAWAGGNGGVFPDSLGNVADWLRAAGKYDWSQETKDEKTLKTLIGQAFFKLNSNSNWIYRGKGVKQGDATTPIFWRPAGSGKFQVIHGDLGVRLVDKKDLPE